MLESFFQNELKFLALNKHKYTENYRFHPFLKTDFLERYSCPCIISSVNVLVWFLKSLHVSPFVTLNLIKYTPNFRLSLIVIYNKYGVLLSPALVLRFKTNDLFQFRINF
jgi:hypothetical protein